MQRLIEKSAFRWSDSLEGILSSSRVTGNPEVIGSSAGLVPLNALVLSDLANFRVVGNPEAIRFDVVEKWLGRVLFGIASAMGVLRY